MDLLGEEGVEDGLRWFNSHFGMIYCQPHRSYFKSRTEGGVGTCRFLSIWTSGRGVIAREGVTLVEGGRCGDSVWGDLEGVGLSGEGGVKSPVDG